MLSGLGGGRSRADRLLEACFVRSGIKVGASASSNRLYQNKPDSNGVLALQDSEVTVKDALRRMEPLLMRGETFVKAFDVLVRLADSSLNSENVGFFIKAIIAFVLSSVAHSLIPLEECERLVELVLNTIKATPDCVSSRTVEMFSAVIAPSLLLRSQTQTDDLYSFKRLVSSVLDLMVDIENNVTEQEETIKHEDVGDDEPSAKRVKPEGKGESKGEGCEFPWPSVEAGQRWLLLDLLTTLHARAIKQTWTVSHCESLFTQSFLARTRLQLEPPQVQRVVQMQTSMRKLVAEWL